MNKKHYIAIAAMLKAMDTDSLSQQSIAMYKSVLVAKLSRLFMKDNDAFSPAKFRAACYAGEKEESNA